MRLVDADALKAERKMADRCEDCTHDARMCQYNQDYSRMDICSMLDDAPTIGAIPVEWVRNMMVEREVEESRAAWLVLREWKKEQEAI